MSLQFLNLPRILVKLDVKYIVTPYGLYGVADADKFAKKLHQNVFG